MANCITANHTIFTARRSLRDCPAFAACLSSIAAQAISRSETDNPASTTQSPEPKPSIERESLQPLSRTDAHSLLVKGIHEISYPKISHLQPDLPSSH